MDLAAARPAPRRMLRSLHKAEGFNRKKDGARESLEAKKEGVFLDKASFGQKGPARDPILRTVFYPEGWRRRP